MIALEHVGQQPLDSVAALDHAFWQQQRRLAAARLRQAERILWATAAASVMVFIAVVSGSYR